MKVIAISGKARSGKDFTGELMRKHLTDKGYNVLVTHYADLLKYLCKSLFNWDGKKDENGRHILQYVGTEVVRKKEPDFWVDFVIKILHLFEYEWDYVIIPDCRFPNEIDKLIYEFSTVSVRIERPGFESGLTDEAKRHISETALDNYSFDAVLVNDGTEAYEDVVKRFLNEDIHNVFGPFLVCNYCGYKQFDPVTIDSYARLSPNIPFHDIPYMCPACENAEEGL